MASNPNSTGSHSSSRVYSLDALRAVMMLLGLVIHCGVIYSPYLSQVKTIQAQETHPVFHYLVEFIHTFRMQVFFLVSGYFGALLFYRKGQFEMLRNRVTRILLPMIVFTIILHPLLFLTKSFSMNRIAGSPDAWAMAWSETIAGKFLPFQLSHLWFLYFLLVMSLISWIAAILVRALRIPMDGIGKAAGIILGTPALRIIIIAILYLGGLWINNEYSLHTSVTFTLDKRLLLCYSIFYAAGWATFTSGALDKLRWKPLAQLLTGILFFIAGSVLESEPDTDNNLRIQQALHALTTTFLTFGIIAFFLERFNSYSKIMAYIMDASFFVYLVNPPFVLTIPGLLAGTQLPAAIQFSITILLSTTLSFLLYHTMARRSFIGKFLNGKLIWKARPKPEGHTTP